MKLLVACMNATVWLYILLFLGVRPNIYIFLALLTGTYLTILVVQRRD